MNKRYIITSEFNEYFIGIVPTAWGFYKYNTDNVNDVYKFHTKDCANWFIDKYIKIDTNSRIWNLFVKEIEIFDKYFIKNI